MSVSRSSTSPALASRAHAVSSREIGGCSDIHENDELKFCVVLVQCLYIQPRKSWCGICNTSPASQPHQRCDLDTITGGRA